MAGIVRFAEVEAVLGVELDCGVADDEAEEVVVGVVAEVGKGKGDGVVTINSDSVSNGV